MTDTRQPLPDREARRLAATDFRRNLVVVAGAGTGKTSLLVERALNAIGGGRVPVTGLGTGPTYLDDSRVATLLPWGTSRPTLRALTVTAASLPPDSLAATEVMPTRTTPPSSGWAHTCLSSR